MNKSYSKNKRAEKVMGMRPEGTPIDYPCELGFKCPIHGNTLWWSEYKAFMWCSVCGKDIPSPLCMPDLDKATEIFLDIVEEYKKGDK